MVVTWFMIKIASLNRGHVIPQHLRSMMRIDYFHSDSQSSVRCAVCSFPWWLIFSDAIVTIISRITAIRYTFGYNLIPINCFTIKGSFWVSNGPTTHGRRIPLSIAWSVPFTVVELWCYSGSDWCGVSKYWWSATFKSLLQIIMG